MGHLISKKKNKKKIIESKQEKDERITFLEKELERYRVAEQGVKNEMNAEAKHQTALAIKHFVDSLIEDEDINIPYVPDCIERRIYRNVLKLVLGTADRVLQSTFIELLGHRIRFDLEPVSPSSDDELSVIQQEEEVVHPSDDNINS